MNSWLPSPNLIFTPSASRNTKGATTFASTSTSLDSPLSTRLSASGMRCITSGALSTCSTTKPCTKLQDSQTNGRGSLIGRQLLGDLIGGRIASDRRLLQLGSELGRLDHFDDALFGRRKKHLEGFDVRVKSPFFELGEDPVRIVFVVGRPHVVRTRTQALHVLTQILRDDTGLKFFLPIALCLRGLRRVASQTGSVGRRGLRRLCKSEMSGPGHDYYHCDQCDAGDKRTS